MRFSNRAPVTCPRLGWEHDGAGAWTWRGTQNAGGVGMMAAMGQRLILIDAQGIVLSDTQNELVGQQISSTQLENGAPIMVDKRQVGTIMVTPNNVAASGTLAGEFLTSVNRAIVGSAVSLASWPWSWERLLSIQITALTPVEKKAASAIAQGDLNQRVNIQFSRRTGRIGADFQPNGRKPVQRRNPTPAPGSRCGPRAAHAPGSHSGHVRRHAGWRLAPGRRTNRHTSLGNHPAKPPGGRSTAAFVGRSRPAQIGTPGNRAG